MTLTLKRVQAENQDDILLKNVVVLVAFLSRRQKYDEREQQQEDGIYIAISTFWMEEIILHGMERSLIRSLCHHCVCKQEL